MTEYTELVSIIVPVYGTETYLPACIESICRQTYSRLQIILVDDQSPDKCPEICDSYADKDSRITVIHQKNKGVSGARNSGMRHAEGDYIMFLDSDDELCPDAVEILLSDAVHSGADIASGTLSLIDAEGKTISSCDDGSVSIFCGDEPLLLSLGGDTNTESACAKLFKADLIGEIRFEEGKRIHEDGFFVFQCYMKKPLVIHRNKSVYRYNARQGSSSRQNFNDGYLSMLYFLERKKELLSAYPEYTAQAHNMEVRTNLQLLDVLCSTTDKKYRKLQKKCVKTVKKLKRYHISANGHHKQLIKIVSFGLYPFYKIAVQLKYYR